MTEHVDTLLTPDMLPPAGLPTGLRSEEHLSSIGQWWEQRESQRLWHGQVPNAAGSISPTRPLRKLIAKPEAHAAVVTETQVKPAGMPSGLERSMRFNLGLPSGNTDSKHTTYKMNFQERPAHPHPKKHSHLGQFRRKAARLHEAVPNTDKQEQKAFENLTTEYSRQFQLPEAETRTVAVGTEPECVGTETQTVDVIDGGVELGYNNLDDAPVFTDRDRAGAWIDPADRPPAGIVRLGSTAADAEIDHVAALLGLLPKAPSRHTETQRAYKWPKSMPTDTTQKPKEDKSVWVSADLGPPTQLNAAPFEVSTYDRDFAWPEIPTKKSKGTEDKRRRVQVGDPGDTLVQIRQIPNDATSDGSQTVVSSDDYPDPHDLDEMEIEAATSKQQEPVESSVQEDDDYNTTETPPRWNSDLNDEVDDYAPVLQDSARLESDELPLRMQSMDRGKRIKTIADMYRTEYSERYKPPQSWIRERIAALSNESISGGSGRSIQRSDQVTEQVPAVKSTSTAPGGYTSAFLELRAKAQLYKARSRRTDYDVNLNNLADRQRTLLARALKKKSKKEDQFEQMYD